MTGSSGKLRKAVLGALMIGLLIGAGYSQRYLNSQRELLGLTRIAPLENAPPVLAFTTKALGGFRGLIANALWIRATELQDEGKYFEMVQLSDWITKLEPKLSAVWINLAWNMSYNISVKFRDPEDRWEWVKRGIELLRDEAIQYNPKEPLLYRELAWHFQHKLGYYLDDAHQYYKAMWANQMDTVIGTGPVNWEELLHPTTPEAKERVRVLRQKFKMDPEWMKKVDEHYGPLEWHLPEASAIYWASLGLEKSKGQELRKEDYIQLRRVIFQSLQLAFMRGKLIYRGTGTDFIYGPNLEIIKQTSDAYLEQAELEPDMRDNILHAHRNFLAMAVYHLYENNRKQAAAQWFKYLLQTYPNSIKPELRNLDDYVFSRVAQDVGETDPNRVKSAILGAYERAFLAYSMGQEDVAQNNEIWAKRLWTRYMASIGSSEKNKVRVGLPDLALLRREQLLTVLSPDYGLDPILAAQLRTRLNLPSNFGASTNSAPSGATAPAQVPGPTQSPSGNAAGK
jgi:hypothetical protein